MPAPLDPAKRQAIADAIRAGAGQRSAGSIAREHGVGKTTVLRIAEQNGLGHAWDRTLTSRATESLRSDHKARRVEESTAALDEMSETRARFRAPSEQLLTNGEIVTLDRPPARDLRDLVMAWQALAKTHMELDRHDSGDDGNVEARSLISEFMDAVTGSLTRDDER